MIPMQAQLQATELELAVPVGWQSGELFSFVELQRGVDLPVQARRHGAIPIFGSNGLLGFHDASVADGPGVITGRSGTIGKLFYTAGKYWPLNTSLHVKNFKGNLPKFVYYKLSEIGLDKFSTGTGVPTLNRNVAHKEPVIFPPVPEQHKIAAILTTVDDKLDVIARQIEAAHALKRGLMQTLFSRGLGAKHACDWAVVALHQVAEIRTGVAKGKKGLKNPVELPYLRVANVQDGHIDLSELKTIEVEAAQVERYALLPGDVLMTEGGDFDKLGRGDVWKGQIAPCLHQNHVFAVRPDPDKLNSSYLAALAASDYGRQYFLSCAKRTTNLASINSSQLKAFPVLLPPLAVQDEISQTIDAASAKVAVLKEKQTSYQALKRGLMQKLLTGEWRVKVETVMPEAEAEVTA